MSAQDTELQSAAAWSADWQEIVKHSPDWMYVLSQAGIIIDCNPQMCRALKVPKEKVVGTPLTNWVSREDRTLAQRGLEQLKNKRPQVRTTRVMQAVDRTFITVEAIEIGFMREGELAQVSGVARDISEEVVLERKLWDAGDSHEQAVDFALRTSLGLVKGYVYALGQSPDLDVHRRRRYIAVIEEEIEHLAKLVDDLLDVQKLDPASLDMRGEYVDPLACVRSAIAELQAEADRREIEVLNSGPETALPLYGTLEVVRRIALNLIQNAIQHTQHSGRVHVEWTDHNEWAELRVRDNGNGIPEQILPHIFDRFYRGPGQQGDSPGIGLGLAVTQMFVRAMGGKISVQSALGKGSEFTVVLPRRYADMDDSLTQSDSEETPLRELSQAATV